MTDPLGALADLAGILPVYTDTTGQRRPTPPETMRAVLAAMGLQADTSAAAAEQLADLQNAAQYRALPPWVVVDANTSPALPLPDDCHWDLTLEDGTCATGRGGAVPVLPLGRHRLSANGQVSWLLAAPATLPLPPRGWGVTLPLYGLRPPERGGLGDYADLAVAAAGLGQAGAGFVGINPIHAGFPTAPHDYSPYAPSHRRRLNVLHINCAKDRAARGSAFVDYRASTALRTANQNRSFAEMSPDPEFDAWHREGGQDLHRFSLHQALSEAHGPYWKTWPTAFQTPESPECIAFASAHGERLRFHAWRQWRAHTDLCAAAQAAYAAGMAHGLYLDLAVGTHPFGAETWADRAVFARGVSLGAPPDAFAAEGQVWGIAPFNPQTLIETGFAALAETLRCQFRYARLLRIDHILGFERAFWVPMEGGLPGAYVTMPRDAMLAVTRIEAARAGATVIGEDLGNIPDGLQAKMATSGLLGCRIVQFEQDAGPQFRPAADYAPATLAAFGTHDLPTWCGWRSGRDIDARAALDGIDADTAQTAQQQRQREVAAFDRTAGGVPGNPANLDAFLGATGSRLVALQIEDLLEVQDQENLPGTVHEYPNWRRRLPIGPDAFPQSVRIANAARAMSHSGRGEDPCET